ncbi:hypothetical protein SOVF_103600 [Spinacia oleracea]|nr:hypothetical protein SOVF_103600 [Spinacia oleracea]
MAKPFTPTMENRTDFESVRQFLPPLTTQPSGHLAWPNHKLIDTLKLISQGPSQSQVNSGARLFSTISRLRDCLPFSSDQDRLATSTGNGFARFFDELLPKEKTIKWFGEIVPVMADFILRLPSLLEMHYQNCDDIVPGVSTGLRLLEPQQPGIVFLSQELIAALLSCSFFCLFPAVIVNRYANLMQAINMDRIFASVHDRFHEQENKIECIMHYFERVCSSTPLNFVSFERKVLSLEQNPSVVALPPPKFWANSVVPLCKFKVYFTGMIEDHPAGSLEVDFADEYIGGLTLTDGCLQEEILFVIKPELIAAMLFLPSMSENEAIEMVGAERFSNYKGYDAKFQFDGDHVDNKEIDPMGRRVSRVIAIDALRLGWAGARQYKHENLLREVNKAFCGFLDHSKYQQKQVPDSDVGIVTGNWGCGVFGGDPEIKSIIQWVAASQASLHSSPSP